jgi:hypothetical protein
VRKMHVLGTGWRPACCAASGSPGALTIVFVSLHTISPSQGCTYSPASTTSAVQEA